jgi:ribose transport system substrate-binding protein
MKKQLFKVASVLMAVSMVLSGFGVTAVAASTVAADGGGEIAVIVKTGNSSFWQNVQTGAMDAQKELKAQTPKLSVTFLGAQSESNVNEQINIVESAIDRGVKAIVLAPSDTKALQPLSRKLKMPVSRLSSSIPNLMAILHNTSPSWLPTTKPLAKPVPKP